MTTRTEAEIAAETLSKAISAFGGMNAPTLMAGTAISDLYTALSGATKLDSVPGLMKATFGQSGSAISGLTAYDLEPGAKLLYPVLTPLRNMIPRVSGKGGLQANWRAVTAIDTTKTAGGVSEGNRGGVINVTTADYIAAYRGLGVEANATFEAQYAAEGFDDVRARASQMGLQSLMLLEERVILGGNNSIALGTTPTPSLSAATTGGTLATATYSVICVALTQDGYFRATLAGGIQQNFTRTNADGSTDSINGGSGRKSTAATVAVTGATGSMTATVAAVRGAMAYAWYWGAAGAEVLGALTTVPKLVIGATAAGTQTAASLAATDFSQDSLVFDGLLTQALKSGSNAYWTDLGGATFTSDGAGGIVEWDALLKDRWDNFRLNPDTVWVSSQQANDVGKKIIAGSANAALRFNVDIKQGMIGGGLLATTYLNKFGLNGATEVQIKQHPNITPGTVLFTQSSIPYPLADVNNIVQIKTRQDYYQIEWPWRSRKYEYGVYMDGVLQHYFPPAMGVITGIAAG